MMLFSSASNRQNHAGHLEDGYQVTMCRYDIGERDIEGCH